MRQFIAGLVYVLVVCAVAYGIETINNGETGLQVRTKLNNNFSELEGNSLTAAQKSILGHLTEETDRVVSNIPWEFPTGTVFLGNDTAVTAAVKALGVRSDELNETFIILAQEYDNTGFSNAFVYRTVAADTVDLNDPAGSDNSDTAVFSFDTTADELIHRVDVPTTQVSQTLSFTVAIRLGGQSDPTVFDFSGDVTTDGTGMASLDLRMTGNPIIVDSGTTLYVNISCTGMIGNQVSPGVFIPNATVHRVQLARSDVATSDNVVGLLEAKTGNDRLDVSAIKNLDTVMTQQAIVAAGTGISVAFDGTRTYTVSAIQTPPHQTAAVSSFSINIPRVVSLNTDLNQQYTVSYHAQDVADISALTLVVSDGDNKTLTVPSADGDATEAVTLSGISTTTAKTLSFSISGTTTGGGTFQSNAYNVSVRDTATHEFVYYGLSSQNNPSTIDIATLTGVETTGAGQQIPIDLTPTAGQYLIILVPDDQPLTEIRDTTFNQNVTNTFIHTNDVRQINSVNTDSYVLGPLNANRQLYTLIF